MKTLLEKMQFKYCPKCSSGNLSVRHGKAVYCADCDYLYFHNNAAAVSVIIEHAGKIILVKRGREPKKGMLDLPGGFVDPGESFEQCAHREISEELGINIENLKYYDSAANSYIYRGVEYTTTDCVMTCSTPNFDQIAPNDDVSDYVLLAKNEINIDDIAFVSTKEILKKYILE